MISRYSRRLQVVSVTLLNVFLLSATVFAQAPTNARVMQIVKQAVGESGHSIITLGSWVSGVKYGDPLKGLGSDHDMRLLLPKGSDPKVAIEQWKTARTRVVELVKKEFGSDAKKILDTINLYPPAQLMEGVEGQAEALEKFREMRIAPNLGFTGPPERMPAEAAEGLYGPGAATWTQKYEEAAGRLVYKHNNEVYTGITDLTHLSEGEATYSSSGMANTASQWTEHANDALVKGKGDKVAKYLERLERDMTKARDLERMSIHGAARDELHSLASELRAHPEHLRDLTGRVQAVLYRSKMESAILARVGNAGLAQKAVLNLMLEGLDAHSKLTDALKQAAEKVPLDTVLNGIMAYIAVTEISRATGESDPGKALVSAAQYLSPLGAGLLAALAQASLDAAKDAGYSLMASSQEPFDLLAGIYTAGGRPDPNGKAYTLDQLVSTYRDEAKLRSFVFALAQRAASRNAGAATGAADLHVANAIMDRCFPVILRAWRAKREMLASEYLDLAKTLRTYGPVLFSSPNPAVRDRATGKVMVTVTAESTDPQFSSHHDRMAKIMDILYGPGAFVSITDRWDGGGTEGNQANQRRYAFAQDGVYTVHLSETIVTGGALVPRDSPLLINIETKAAVDVPVGGKSAAPPPPPKTVSKLAELQKCNEVALSVWFPEAETGLDGFSYRERKGFLNGINNSGVRIRNNTERYTVVLAPLQWSGTKFTVKAIDDYAFVQGTPKVVTTIVIEGEVNPEGTQLLKATATRDAAHEEVNQRYNENYYRHETLTLVDLPLNGLLGILEGKAVMGHVTGVSDRWFLPSTGNNKWKLYGINFDKLETSGDKAKVSIAFSFEKP